MKRKFDEQHCSIAQTLAVLGDGWTLLILREAFLGARRFGELQRRLDIARNILSARLAHLVEHGVLHKVDVGIHGTHFEYELSPRGKDLVTVLTALREWGDHWIYGDGHEPVVVVDRRTGRRVPRLRILGEDGAPLSSADMELRPGPGRARG